MKKLNRILFDLNKNEFFDYAVEDLFGSIPARVSDNAISILSEQRTKVDKWFLWQAFVLQRRLVNNPTEAAAIMGMLLQIKVMMHMLSGGIVSEELAPDTSPAAKAMADRIKKEAEEHEKELKGVDAFKKGKVEEKE